MKRSFCIFAAVFALALAFSVGANAALMRHAGDYAVSGEVLLGERAGARGFTVDAAASVSRHLLWDMEYDPASGACSTSALWSRETLPKLSGQEAAAPEWAEYSFYESCTWKRGTEPDFPSEGLEKIYEEYVLECGAAGEFAVPAAEFYERLPVRLVHGSGAVENVYLPVPAELEIRVRFESGRYNSLSVDAFSINLQPWAGYRVSAGGYMYFALEMQDDVGRTLPDGLQCGGGVYVWRVPESGETAEPVARIDADALYKLAPSPEGGSLFLYSSGGDALDIAVIDAESGRVVQRETLFSMEEISTQRTVNALVLTAESFGSDAGTVFVFVDGFAVAAERSGDTYSFSEPVELSLDCVDVPLSPGTKPYYSIDAADARLHGGRMALMLDVTFETDKYNVAELYHALCVYEHGEPVYVEWFTRLVPEASIETVYYDDAYALG